MGSAPRIVETPIQIRYPETRMKSLDRESMRIGPGLPSALQHRGRRAATTAEPSNKTAKRGSAKILWTAVLKASGTAMSISTETRKTAVVAPLAGRSAVPFATAECDLGLFSVTAGAGLIRFSLHSKSNGTDH